MAEQNDKKTVKIQDMYISPGISRERSFIRTSNQQVIDMVIIFSLNSNNQLLIHFILLEYTRDSRTAGKVEVHFTKNIFFL